jgi:hypothetical protein
MMAEKYKSKRGKKVFIEIDVFNDKINRAVNLFVLDSSDKFKPIFSLHLKVDFMARNQFYSRIETDDELFALLKEYGLRMTKEKIDNEYFETEEKNITYETGVELLENSFVHDSSKEIFMSRSKIQQDILACLYKQPEGSATSKEIINYVWCDGDLLLSELNYLGQEGFIICRVIGGNLPELLNKEGDERILATLLPKGKTRYQENLQDDIFKMNIHLDKFKNCLPFASNKVVFLAHSFGEEGLIKEIETKLTEQKFNFKEGKVEDLSSISEDILNKIRESGFFLALLTPKKEFKEKGFSAGPWILMEIGAALAYGRKVLILAEDEVDKDQYESKLQGDYEYLNFNRDNFPSKVKQAVGKIIKEWEKYQIG